MRYYAVIDTNVIVSSMLKHDSIPGKITDLVVSNVIVPLLNEEILDEYFEVLTKNKFNFEINNVQRAIAIIKEKGLLLTREQSLEDFIDEDDIVFDRGKIIQYSNWGIGKPHIIPQLLTLFNSYGRDCLAFYHHVSLA